MLRFGVLLGACALLAGCSSSTTSERHEADVKAIRAIEEAWAKDIQAGNVDRWVSYYDENGSMLTPNAPPITGRENIRAALQGRVKGPLYRVTIHTQAIEVSQNLAYSRGVYEFVARSSKTHELVSDQGKYLTVYKRQPDGGWKAIQDMGSSDMPAVPTP